MPLLNEIAYKIRKFPKLKKTLKNIYQYIGNFLSDKKTIPKEIKLISNKTQENLFGYYDKCPWNKTEDKMLYLQVKDAYKDAAPMQEAKIILKDLKTNEEKEIAITKAWNVQQGCMLQWLGPDFNSKILYNDFIANSLRTVILDIETMEKHIIDYPVYTVDKSGNWGLTLDFYRLHRMRPGYGYSNKEDRTKEELLPNDYCIWKVDFEKNTAEGIIKYQDLYEKDFKESMEGAEHKVNHIMINPEGSRFMFLHRWFKNGVKNTRLLTANIDGKNICNLLDEGMTSHCTWKDNDTILGWARKEDLGTHYYLIKDKTAQCKIIAGEKLLTDGHPSYSPNGKYFVTDTYPDFKRKQHIYIYQEEKDKLIDIATVYAHIKYKGDCRCDLHPRWSPSGTKICFDGAQDTKRQVYVIDVKDKIDFAIEEGKNSYE